MLISPLAGALVDRWDRKQVMMLSDLAAGLSTIAVFLLFSSDNLEIWHLYVTEAFAGVFQYAHAVQSSFGAGFSRWNINEYLGWTRKKDQRSLGGLFMLSLFGELLGFGQSPIVWMAAAFLMMLFIPVLNGCSQALWMSKVPPEFQGRIFVTRRLISQPLAMILTGPLADWVFEPAMQQGGSLADVFGWLGGTGDGTGMALIFVFMGISGGLIRLLGYSIKAIRDVEDLIPDFDSTDIQ